jgi:hypothetical protein
MASYGKEFNGSPAVPRRHQGGSLVVRGKKRKRYVLRWREDVVKPDGAIGRIQRGETIGLVSQMRRPEALEILQSRVTSVEQQRHQPRVAITLSEFVRAKWKPNARLALKKSSMRIHGFQLKRHILPALGTMPLRDIDRSQIETCLSTVKRKGHAISTVATFARHCRACYRRPSGVAFWQGTPHTRDLHSRSGYQERAAFLLAGADAKAGSSAA